MVQLFQPTTLGNVTVKNRIIRSATYEGMCDSNGFPTQEYFNFNSELAQHQVGTIITGFAYVTPNGKAMQPGQAGIDSPEKISAYARVVKEVHQYGCKIFMQISHTGRQTREVDIKEKVVGVSAKRSFYFGSRPEVLSTEQVLAIADSYADAAYYAQQAGFDGIQLHGAHGYLIHQFLLPAINNRRDQFQIDPETGIGTRFFELVIDKVRQKCGQSYPILVKVSGEVDYRQGFSSDQFERLIRFLDQMQVAGIEVSYGTMDYALNIFRGEIPIDLILKQHPIYGVQNPFLRKVWKRTIYPLLKLKIKEFTPLYNLEYAKLAKKITKLPIILVGGIRTGTEMNILLEKGDVDFISISRPLLREPDLVEKLIKDKNYVSQCTNCNLCVIMCDSSQTTKCYRKGNEK